MIDTLVKLLPKAQTRWEALKQRLDITSSAFILVTLHRPSNVDHLATLTEIMKSLVILSQRYPVVFPVHPRTKKQMVDSGLSWDSSLLRLIEPLGYLDFLALEANAKAVITDSGGVQEETTYLGCPCITVRSNTERPITITQGTNRLVNSKAEDIVTAFTEQVDVKHQVKRLPELWDGCTAQRIVKILCEYNEGMSS